MIFFVQYKFFIPYISGCTLCVYFTRNLVLRGNIVPERPINDFYFISTLLFSFDAFQKVKKIINFIFDMYKSFIYLVKYVFTSYEFTSYALRMHRIARLSDAIIINLSTAVVR